MLGDTTQSSVVVSHEVCASRHRLETVQFQFHAGLRAKKQAFQRHRTF